MKLKQISKWISYEAMIIKLKNEIIKSWLLEKGPITKKIKSNEKFWIVATALIPVKVIEEFN